MFILISLCFSASAGIIPFLDKAEWLNALNQPVLQVDDFDGNKSSFGANSTDNLLAYSKLNLLGGEGDPGPTGLTGFGYF